jgi:hypothetical protein
MLLAVVKIPADAEARLRAAQVAGLAPADLDRRLVGTLPRVLLTGLSDATATELAGALEALGFVVVACDPRAAPGDGDRVVARAIELADRALVITDAQGEVHTCGRGAIDLYQRGLRMTRTSTKVTTSERRLDLGKALVTGGLLLTRKVEKTRVKTRENEDAFLLIRRNDGEPDVMLYERRIDYRFLGAEMLPSSHANLELVHRRLCALAPGAPTDERVADPGFVSGLPTTGADPVDLALLLVALARLKER